MTRARVAPVAAALEERRRRRLVRLAPDSVPVHQAEVVARGEDPSVARGGEERARPPVIGLRGARPAEQDREVVASERVVRLAATLEEAPRAGRVARGPVAVVVARAGRRAPAPLAPLARALVERDGLRHVDLHAVARLEGAPQRETRRGVPALARRGRARRRLARALGPAAAHDQRERHERQRSRFPSPHAARLPSLGRACALSRRRARATRAAPSPGRRRRRPPSAPSSRGTRRARRPRGTGRPRSGRARLRTSRRHLTGK